MKLQKLRLILITVSFVIAVVWTKPSQSQEVGKITVPLKLNLLYEQFAGFEIKLDNNGTGNIRLGKAPGGVLVSAEKLSDPKFTYRIKVDSDGGGTLENNSSQEVMPDSSITLQISRKWADKQQKLPYSIRYGRHVDKSNEVRESFLWFSHYRAEGKFRSKNCEALLAVLDLNGDGVFDQRDFSSGTSIGLDRNHDGRIWGKEEWLKGKQVVEYCGAAFLIDNVELDGSAITVIESTLRIPKLGDPCPTISLATDDGKTIESSSFRDKIVLLDFWASWCSPCVGKFVDVIQLEQEYGNELETIAINVDEQSGLQSARQIIKNYDLKWPQVMSGQGENDPMWKMFGGMANNRLAIPLYVLVDRQGLLRYAGNGGDNLSELRTNIQMLVQMKPTEIIKR